jgi:hypothetical protein
MKKITLLVSVLIVIILSSCKQQKYEMHNMMPMLVDVSEYINSGDFIPDSCKHRLNRLKRTSPLVLDESHETLLQIKLKKWKANYNHWLRQNKRDTVYFNLESLAKRTKYQYSYVITDKPVDVYRTDTPLSINGIENIHFYIQLDDKGEFVSDFSENNYQDTSCDTDNSEFQDIYTVNP